MKCTPKLLFVLIILFKSIVWAQPWQNGVFLKKPRAGAAATAWNGKIYVFGGKSINNKILNSVEVFDPAVEDWDTTLVPPFTHARYNASICVWANKFYLTGGRTLDGALKSMEVYDPVKNSWEEAHDLLREREGHSANYFNNRVYVIGGQSNSDSLIESIEWYDTNAEQWKDALFTLPYPRSAQFAATNNDDYYMFGGYYYGLTNTIYKATKKAEGYTWEEIGHLSQKRAYGITAKIDSSIYLIGGETQSGKTNLVEIFNINTRKITIGEDMNMSHSGMTSAVLNHKIYSIGGYEAYSNEPVNHVHVYTPPITSLHSPEPGPPENAILVKAYPNPFNGQVNIKIDLPKKEFITMHIFNITGQLIFSVKKLITDQIIYNWNAKDNNNNSIPSGIYFAEIKSGTQLKIIKLVYVK